MSRGTMPLEPKTIGTSVRVSVAPRDTRHAFDVNDRLHHFLPRDMEVAAPPPPPQFEPLAYLVGFDVGYRQLPGALIEVNEATGKVRLMSARLWDLQYDTVRAEYDAVRGAGGQYRSISRIDTTNNYVAGIPKDPRVLSVDIFLVLGRRLYDWSAPYDYGKCPIYIEPQPKAGINQAPTVFSISKAIISTFSNMDRAHQFFAPYRLIEFRAKKSGLGRPRKQAAAVPVVEDDADSVPPPPLPPLPPPKQTRTRSRSRPTTADDDRADEPPPKKPRRARRKPDEEVEECMPMENPEDQVLDVDDFEAVAESAGHAGLRRLVQQQPPPPPPPPRRRLRRKADREQELVPLTYEERKAFNLVLVKERLLKDGDMAGLDFIQAMERANAINPTLRLGVWDVGDALGIAITRADERVRLLQIGSAHV